MSVKDADGHKLILYPKEVNRVIEGDFDNSLLQVEIGPTNVCNHHCNYCALEWVKRDGDYIEKQSMFSALEDMSKMGVLGVYFAGEGEPLIHKYLPEFIKKASDLEIGVSLSTNGSLLTKDISEKILPYLSWIRIGVDASTPETYSKIHGVPKSVFKKVIDNLTSAAIVKKNNNYKVDIGVQSLLLTENVQEAVSLTSIIKDTGVDNIQIKPFAQHPYAKTRNDLVNYDDLRLIEIKKEAEKFEDENFKVVYRDQAMRRVIDPAADYTECGGLAFWTLIDAKGEVIPCNPCYDKPEFSFGNIHNQSFKDIWFGLKRKDVLKNLKRSECKEYICRLDIFNRFISRIKNKEPNDCFI